MPQPISDAQLAAITDAILDARKIEAIKLYRETTGQGLKESKEAVEAIEADLRVKFPEKFAGRPAGKGCAMTGASMIMFVVAIGAGAAWFIAR